MIKQGPNKEHENDEHIMSAETTISDLTPWTGGYTLPWAFMRDDHGRLYVRGFYPVEPDPHGTLNQPIARGPDGLLYTTPVPEKHVAGTWVIEHAIRVWGAERVYVIDGSAAPDWLVASTTLELEQG